MAVETQSGVPCRITAGDAVSFTLSDTEHGASEWYLDFVLTRNGLHLLTKRATAVSDDYTVALPASETTTVTPGRARWVLVFTEIASDTQRETGDSGDIMVAPNPLVSMTATDAQNALATCKAAIATLTATPEASTSFNGQSVTYQDISKLYEARDRLQAEVNAELAALGLSNRGGARLIRFRFT